MWCANKRFLNKYESIGFGVLTTVTEECGLLGSDAMQFGDSPMFQRNISPPSSGSKGK
jgi:hypothetical protein